MNIKPGYKIAIRRDNRFYVLEIREINGDVLRCWSDELGEVDVNRGDVKVPF